MNNDEDEFENEEEDEELMEQEQASQEQYRPGKTKVKMKGKVANGARKVVKGAVTGMKQVLMFAISHPWILLILLFIVIMVCIWFLIAQEMTDSVTKSVDDFVNNTEGIDDAAKDLYNSKHSLLLLKVSEVNKMYDSFMADEGNSGDLKTSMKAIIGTNEVENKKATSGGTSPTSPVENNHNITCSATGIYKDEELIQISRVVQATCGLNKEYEEYLPMAAMIVNRLKLKICGLKRTNKLPGIIDDPTQFPAISTDAFNNADASQEAVAFKAILSAFNGEDPTGGATFYSKASDKKWDKQSYEKVYSAKKVSSDKDNYYVYWKKKGQKTIKKGPFAGFECESTGNYIPYIQNDPRWGAVRCVNNGMSSQGCGPTSVAVILAYLNIVIEGYDGVESVNLVTNTPYKTAKDGVMEPVEVAKIIYDNPGYFTSDGVSWSFFPYIFQTICGLDGVQVGSSQEALKYLEQGYVGVASCAPGLFTSGGHIIAIMGAKEGKIQVHNVNSSNNDGYYPPSELETGAAGNIRQYWLYKKTSK